MKKETPIVQHNPRQETHFRGFGEEGGHTGEPKKNSKLRWVPSENIEILKLLEEIKEILLRIERK